jgi:PAS domain S-box-containing protein
VKTAVTLTVDSLLSDPLQYKKIIENNSVAFILGVNGNTILYNDAAAQLFGYTKEEFCGVHRDRLFLNNEDYRNALKK